MLRSFVIVVGALAVMHQIASVRLVKANASLVAHVADSTQQFERGKVVFGERCAKCHDQDASRRLPDGTTLLQRLARSDNPRALANTRLRKLPTADGEAAWTYLAALTSKATK